MKIANFDPTYQALLGGGMGGVSLIAAAVAGESVFKPSAVRVATTAAGTLATSFEAGDTVDGIVLAEGDRLLVKDQAAGAENGIYVVEATGAPTRAADFDSSGEIVGAIIVVTEGMANGGTLWRNTNTGTITLGTTALTFAGFGPLTVKDEGVALATAATSLDFVGAGVVAAGTGATKTVTIAGVTEAAVRDVGHWEVVVSGSAPPVAVSNPADDDWVFGWVSG